MSPLEIKILLHYSWSPIDYHKTEEPLHAASPAVCEALQMFLTNGLLKSRYTDINWAVSFAPFHDTYQGSKIDGPIFSITDRGSAMVEHLRAVKIPVCQWIQPEDLK